jgi:disulfide bond formation protein DsbB
VSPGPRLLFGAIAACALGAVGAALYTQYQWNMLPCPWCVLQRAIFVAIALAALPGLVLGGLAPRRAAAALVVALGGCGVASSLWLHYVAAMSATCNLTLADRIMGGLGLDTLWPEVFAAQASCADAVASLAGVPYEFVSLALFVALGGVAVWAAAQRRR